MFQQLLLTSVFSVPIAGCEEADRGPLQVQFNALLNASEKTYCRLWYRVRIVSFPC